MPNQLTTPNPSPIREVLVHFANHYMVLLGAVRVKYELGRERDSVLLIFSIQAHPSGRKYWFLDAQCLSNFQEQ